MSGCWSAYSFARSLLHCCSAYCSAPSLLHSLVPCAIIPGTYICISSVFAPEINACNLFRILPFLESWIQISAVVFVLINLKAMRPQAKRVMAPLKKAVWSSLVYVDGSGGSSSSSHSACTSGSEHEIDPHLMICGYESDDAKDQQEQKDEEASEEEEDEDEDCCSSSRSRRCSPDAFKRQINEASALPSLRQQLFRIFQNISVFECRLLQDVARAKTASIDLGVGWDTTTEDKASNVRRFMMNMLRYLGYNAAICKTRWKQTHAYPAGAYDFIDVVVNTDRSMFPARFLVDLDFRPQFEIARATEEYQVLLNDLPAMFVGSAEKLSQIIRFMSDSARRSLKNKDLCIPPWRKYRYMQIKWLGHYKRTPNPIASSSARKSQIMLSSSSVRDDAESLSAITKPSAIANININSTVGNTKVGSALAAALGQTRLTQNQNQIIPSSPPQT